MKRLRVTHYALHITLLLIILAQMVVASPSQSAAFDEGYTITYGYAYLRGGDARLSRGQNPPLTNVFIALPLLLKNDIVFPADDANWIKPDIFGFSDQFMWRVNPDPQRLVLLARLPEMMLALLLACVLFAFTRAVFDDRAALAALFLCAFDPNILAHGHIAGTDLGVTLFMFAAMWQWTIALKHNTVKHAVIAGTLTGAAFATKYSAVWLIPIAVGVRLDLSRPPPIFWATPDLGLARRRGGFDRDLGHICVLDWPDRSRRPVGACAAILAIVDGCSHTCRVEHTGLHAGPDFASGVSRLLSVCVLGEDTAADVATAVNRHRKFSCATSARRCGDVAASGLVHAGGDVWRLEPGLSFDAAGAAVCVDDRRAGR